MEQPDEAQAEDEATTEAGIVDIASILGAPTVTIVRSTLKFFYKLSSSRVDDQSCVADSATF
jgi:hypothetical protein